MSKCLEIKMSGYSVILWKTFIPIVDEKQNLGLHRVVVFFFFLRKIKVSFSYIRGYDDIDTVMLHFQLYNR